MNGTFRKERKYRFRQVPFLNDVTVEYKGADGHGLGANHFYFKKENGVYITLRRGKISPNYIETRRCLEQPKPRKLRVV